MVYYIALFLLVLFFLAEFCGIQKIYAVKKYSLDKIIFIYIAFFLFCIAAFRYKTGRDWTGYIYYFNNCLAKKSSFNFESGFVLLNKFFKKNFDSFYLMQFCTMIFCCYCTYKSFSKRSAYPIFTLFLYFAMYFLQTDMAQTRQHIAMAIILCGMQFIENKKIILWGGCIILAMQFHITALLAFPLYFTANRKVSVKFCVVLFIASIFITFFGLNIIRAMLALVTKLSIVPERIRIIGNSYLNSKIYGQQGQFGSGLGFLVRYAFIALMIFFYKLISKKSDTGNYYFLNFFIALIFQAMGRNFDQFSRIANYYLICGGGLCAYNLLLDAKKFFRKTEVLKIAMCAVFVLFMLYNFYNLWTVPGKHFNSYKIDYTPYRSFIFESN